MSAPVIWIVFPLVVALGQLFLLKYPTILKLTGIVVSLLLALIAFFQPIGNVLRIGGTVLDIRPDLQFLGRALHLDNGDRFILAGLFGILFLYTFLWNTHTVPAKFAPLSLAISAILVAALAVQPFLYAAVLVELAVLLMIVLVKDNQMNQEKGIIRFLVYLTLAMPFILFSGWILGGTQASPSEQENLLGAAITLMIGFSLWLAVFPFHSWVPQFSRAVQPYLSGFIFSLFPIVVLFVAVNYISSLVWLRSASYLAPVLSSTGIIMIVTTGLWASVERDVKRVLGYSVLLETGFSLIMISFKTEQGLTLMYHSLFPRVLSLALMVYTLSILHQAGIALTHDGFQGVIRQYPFAASGFLISLFTISGFPLFAAFPIRLELLYQLGHISVPSVIWTVFGLSGLIFAVIRLFRVMTLPAPNNWRIHESVTQVIIICTVILVLILAGLFPQLVEGIIKPFTADLPLLK